MDSELMNICRDDAEKVCGVKTNLESDPNKLEPERGPLILSCLFRNIGSEKNSQISRPCAEKVKETMRRRAVSGKLDDPISQAFLY